MMRTFCGLLQDESKKLVRRWEGCVRVHEDVDSVLVLVADRHTYTVLAQPLVELGLPVLCELSIGLLQQTRRRAATYIDQRDGTDNENLLDHGVASCIRILLCDKVSRDGRPKSSNALSNVQTRVIVCNVLPKPLEIRQRIIFQVNKREHTSHQQECTLALRASSDP